MASSKNHRRPKDHGDRKPSATANGSAAGAGGGAGGSSMLSKTLTWIVVIALIGVSAALAVTCTQLNEQITKERKVHEEALQKMEEDISAARAEVTVAATERLEALAQTSSLQRDLVAQKEECKSTLKTQLTEMEATNHRLRSELREQEKATEDMKLHNSELESELQEKDHQLTSSNEANQQIEDQLSKLQERAESLEEKLNVKEEELEEAGEKMAQQEEELAGVSTKLQDTLVLVVEHEAKEKQLEDLVEELTLEGKQKDANVEKLENSVNGLKQEYKLLDDLLLDTKTKLIDTEKVLEESKQEVVAKSSLLEAAQSSLRGQEERIAKLVAAQSEDENVKSDLAGKVTRLEALASNLEARLQASDEAYATEKVRLNEQLQKNLETLQEKEEALRKLHVVSRDKDNKILELQAQMVKAESKAKEQPAAREKKQGR